MSSPSRDTRKRLLDDARRALRSGDALQMRTALEGLPASGAKAEILRAELRSRIASGAFVITLPLPARVTSPPPSTAVQTTVGLRYRFVITHSGLSTLFRVRLRGAVVEIAVNASHQAFCSLATSSRKDLSELGKNVLVAWARLHVEAGSEKKREKVDDLAADWARALADVDGDARSDDETLGNLILEMVGAAMAELRLVAPFIKKDVLSKLLQNAPTSAAVTIFTRWRPDEVAAGVSDLEVLDVARARPGTSLYLSAPLHAKYYRADGRILLGSANLTRAALGWSPHSNLELLFEAVWPTPELRTFEETLAASSVPATDEMRDRVAAAAELLGVRAPLEPSEQRIEPLAAFLPRTRNPELLFTAYQAKAEELTTAAREQAALDLSALRVPGGLEEDQFTRFVSVLLMQMPTIAALDRFVAQPRRFGEVRGMVSELLSSCGSDRDPGEAWQTVMRWLLYFVPGRYQMSVRHYSEIFSRVPGA